MAHQPHQDFFSPAATGVKYSLAYPATLRFTLNGSKREFKSPQDAADFVKANTGKTADAPEITGSDDMPVLED